MANEPVAPSTTPATTSTTPATTSDSTASIQPVVDLTAESTPSTTSETAPLESYSLAYVQQSWVVGYVAPPTDLTADDEELLIQLV